MNNKRLHFETNLLINSVKEIPSFVKIMLIWLSFPANIYLFKVRNRRKRCEIRSSGVFIVNLEHSHIFHILHILVFLWLTLNKEILAGFKLHFLHQCNEFRNSPIGSSYSQVMRNFPKFTRSVVNFVCELFIAVLIEDIWKPWWSSFRSKLVGDKATA